MKKPLRRQNVMPDDFTTLTEMLEQVVAIEEKLGRLRSRLRSDAKSRAILERLRKLREDLVEVIEQMKTK